MVLGSRFMFATRQLVTAICALTSLKVLLAEWS